MAEGVTSPQDRPADSEVPGRPHGVRRKKAEGACSRRDTGRFLAQAKTKLQREQRLWELQRPPAGPINTYKCLSKQSFNDGYFTKWVLSLTSKIAVPLRKIELGCRGEGKFRVVF